MNQDQWDYLNNRLDQIDERIETVTRLVKEVLERIPEPKGSIRLKWGVPYNTQPVVQSQGETMAQATETDKQTIPCSAIETDADGAPVTIDPANAQWATSDPSVATVTTDPVTGNGLFKAVGPGSCTATLTDTKTGVVGTLGSDDTPETLVVTKSATTGKMVLNWGTPTP